ncbi:ABC transporter permease subunit [Acinetobacter sp. MD2]|uniref:ABC transporter permease subunit n=1 Tax=Acinetobacter sp. MD2 TaxID=2600066 RepID=UPI002D1F1365|nr:ABC transporter permease subunit [Acinetobacter sp. MD2]MEB3767714.1 ABC transporter permease subunit [Acinetobacter sp. MD2]
MGRYVLKRLVLMLPTLFVILLINFVIVQIAPGGPVEQAILQAQQFQIEPNHPHTNMDDAQHYQGAQGLSPEMLAQLKAQYGFDQPMDVRFWQMLKRYAQLDLGESFFKGKAVSQLIWEKLPVTLSLGGWSLLLIYLIAIPLGIYKAKRHGSLFDRTTSLLLAMAYAVPSLLFGVLLLTLFAGGNYWHWFPLQGLTSENIQHLSFVGKIKDYFWHLTLPVLTLTLGGFASLTYLTQASFIEEMHKTYVLAARAKGLSETQVWIGHIFRNAILVVLASLPETIVGVFFAGTLFVEILFNLDGIALLGFEAVSERDYPIIFGILLLYTLLGLILRLVGDMLYHWIDPRITFDLERAP